MRSDALRNAPSNRARPASATLGANAGCAQRPVRRRRPIGGSGGFVHEPDARPMRRRAPKARHARPVARRFGCAGLDRVVTIDTHIPQRALRTTSVFVAACRRPTQPRRTCCSMTRRFCPTLPRPTSPPQRSKPHLTFLAALASNCRCRLPRPALPRPRRASVKRPLRRARGELGSKHAGRPADGCGSTPNRAGPSGRIKGMIYDEKLTPNKHPSSPRGRRPHAGPARRQGRSVAR